MTSKTVGRASAGRDVFRFETFGNEGFWTDALRLPQGMMAAKVTPIQALQSGLSVDIDAVPAAMREAMAAELKTDMSPQNAPMLNDPKTTMKLVEANAVIGIVPKDSNGDGKIDLANGDKIGISCSLCHTITDGSVHNMPGGGSIGRRIDGPSALTLNVGKQLAVAANSRAYFPFLQTMLGGKTIGRAPKGLTADSTEEEFDAYLTNPEFYPVGTFDDTPDGNGNPVVIQPMFRQDLAKPFGSAGEQASVANFANGVYTVAFDPTSLATVDGLKFLKAVGGEAGEQLSKDYAKILADTGVTGYPFVKSKKKGKPGEPANLVGATVDEQKLADLQAYTESLQAPKGAKVDAKAAARGRKLFAANCTTCHNTDQSKPVSAKLVEMTTIWPGYQPEVLAKRDPPLDPIQNAPGTFDDKMIVVDASPGGGKRGNAIPMLLDLDRKTMFLHDASVKGLDSLLDPSRGKAAPHPFFVANANERDDVVQFLRGLDTGRSSR
ncbi:MAG: hypothetical protein ACR2K5_08495 [Pseudolabrys sp.]